MKRLMQIALASFGVLALMLAGCNTTTSTETPTTDGTTGTTVEGSADVTVPTTDTTTK